MIRLFASLIVSALFVAGCSVEASTDANPDTKPHINKQAKKAGKKTSGEKPAKQNIQKSNVKSDHSNVVAMLKKLQVAAPHTTGYDRDLFKHWSDLDSDGCDTRKEVLGRENLEKPGGTCDAETGKWFSPYDGATTSDPSSFDIDHMVPLSEAWQSGAYKWDDERREAFANDMHPYSLIAVTAASNRSKSDQDPSEWMPPNSSYVCQYTARWISIKFRWKLAVDSKEKAALNDLVNSCDRADLKLSVKAGAPAAGSAGSGSSVKSAAPETRKPKKSAKSRKVSKPRKSGSGDPLFSTCTEAKANGYGPYIKGKDSEYKNYRDADGDGAVCE